MGVKHLQNNECICQPATTLAGPCAEPWSPAEDRFGCSTQTTVSKSCLCKVLQTVCVPHLWRFCDIFFVTSDFLGQELLRHITVYHMYITWETVFNHANKMFTKSRLQQSLELPVTAVAPSASHYSDVFLQFTHKYIIQVWNCHCFPVCLIIL